MQWASTPHPHSLFPAAEKSALGRQAGNRDGRREMVWVGPGPESFWLRLRKTMDGGPCLIVSGWGKGVT